MFNWVQTLLNFVLVRQAAVDKGATAKEANIAAAVTTLETIVEQTQTPPVQPK